MTYRGERQDKRRVPFALVEYTFKLEQELRLTTPVLTAGQHWNLILDESPLYEPYHWLFKEDYGALIGDAKSEVLNFRIKLAQILCDRNAARSQWLADNHIMEWIQGVPPAIPEYDQFVEFYAWINSTTWDSSEHTDADHIDCYANYAHTPATFAVKVEVWNNTGATGKSDIYLRNIESEMSVWGAKYILS